MAWHDKRTQTEVEDIRIALSTLGHHGFFSAYGEQLKEDMLNAISQVSDSDLVLLMRKYQAQQDLIRELTSVAENEASHLAVILGDEE